MAIWDFFKKPAVEPFEEKMDPIVEQRRKEKFSTPLIYHEEEVQKNEKKNPSIKTSTTVKKNVSTNMNNTNTRIKIESSYTMSEIISPFHGKKEEKVTVKTQNSTPKKIDRRKKMEDQIVPVISPIHGMGSYYEDEEESYEEELLIVEKSENNTASLNFDDLLKDNLLKAENENKKIKIADKKSEEIQTNTTNLSSKKAVTEEIDDAMTLDELMSLYERKFKDGEDE